MRDAIEAALEVMGGLGATVTEVTLPDGMDFHACGRAILLAEAYAIHRRDLLATPERYGALTRDRMRLGAFIGADDYIRAQRVRALLTRQTLAAMAAVDLLVTANQYGPAERFDATETFPYFDKPSLTIPFNLTGQPALTLCCGFDGDGLPLGLQIVGRPFDEATVLRLGHAYEQATSWRARRPPL
jgi:aspartyl-tRNA(Asn)/glutamyl-tRNA(Gln) amidotransferase subunit A